MNDAAIIYRSHIEAIESLPTEQQLSALKAIIHYCMDDDVPDDGVSTCILMMAKPVLDKWKTKRTSGQKGGEANGKQAESKREANVKQTESKPEPKVKVKEKVKDIKEKECKEKESPAKAEPLMVASREVVNYLNEKTGSHYLASTKSTVDMIKSRMKEGHSVDDFKKVIDNKTSEWLGDPEWEKFLRPETLFCAKHFESYLNQKASKPSSRARPDNKFDSGMMRRSSEENKKMAEAIMALR